MGHNPIYIENDRLLIHCLNKQDITGFRSMRRDRLVYRYEPRFLKELQGSPEEALESLQRMDLYENRQCVLGVYEKTDPSVLIGLAEFYDYKPSGKDISLGYRFNSEYWGQGIATSCIHSLLEFIRDKTKVEFVTAHVLPDNKASARCLLKNGFKYLLTKTEDWGYSRLCIADVYIFYC